MLEFIMIIFTVSFFIFCIYGSIKSLIRIFMFFSDFKIIIINFLNENNLKLIEIKNPNFEDWKNNPFKQKDSYFFENMLFFSTLKHKIIIAQNEKKGIEIYWLQAVLKLLKKSEINFTQFGLKAKQEEEIKNEYLKNIIIVENECPACNEKIKKTDLECKNCGLNIQ